MDHLRRHEQSVQSTKASDCIEKRKKFESQPAFIKTGLYYQDKYQSVRYQNFYQRFIVSEILMAKGNDEFGLEKFREATRNFEQALSIFCFVHNKQSSWNSDGILDEDLTYVDDEGKNREEKELIKSMKLSLYLNLATCYFNILDYENSWAACKEALNLDPSNAKGLHLLAKTINHNSASTILELRGALEDLKRACTLDPTNHEIQKDLAKAKMQILKMNAGQMKESQTARKPLEIRENSKLLLSNNVSTKQPNSCRSNEIPSDPRHANHHIDRSAGTMNKPQRPPTALGLTQPNANQANKANEKPQSITNSVHPGHNVTRGTSVSHHPVDFSAEIKQLRKYLGIKEDQPITFNDIIQMAGGFDKMMDIIMLLKSRPNNTSSAAQAQNTKVAGPTEKNLCPNQNQSSSAKEEAQRIQNQNLRNIRNWADRTIGTLQSQNDFTRNRDVRRVPSRRVTLNRFRAKSAPNINDQK